MKVIPGRLPINNNNNSSYFLSTVLCSFYPRPVRAYGIYVTYYFLLASSSLFITGENSVPVICSGSARLQPLPVGVPPLPVAVLPLPVAVLPLPVAVPPLAVQTLPVLVPPLPVAVPPLPVSVPPLPVAVLPLPVAVPPLSSSMLRMLPDMCLCALFLPLTACALGRLV